MTVNADLESKYQDVDPIPVILVDDKTKEERVEAAEFGQALSYSFVGTETVTPIARRDRRRHKLTLSVTSSGNPGLASYASNGQVAGPGAGTVITSVTGIPTGEYVVVPTVRTSVAGAVGNNYGVYVNGVLVYTLIQSTGTSINTFPSYTAQLTQASNTVSIEAIAADAGATYDASLVITPGAQNGQQGYIIVGTKARCQNGTGYYLYCGDKLVYETREGLNAIPDGVHPLTLNVLDEINPGKYTEVEYGV
jgi:hypothetical protein